MNTFRPTLIKRVAILVTLPTFVACSVIAILENRYLTGGWTVPGIFLSLLAGLGASAIVTMIAIATSLTHCPPTLAEERGALVYQRLRWVGPRLRAFRFVLPLASVRSVGPTAFGATQLDGLALARPVDDEGAPPIEVNERLLLAPEIAVDLGLQLTRGFAPWLAGKRGSE